MIKDGLHPYFKLTKFFGKVDGLEIQAGMDYNPTEKILGLYLNHTNDKFTFETGKWLIKKPNINYKQFTGDAKKLYDPMGFVKPYTAYLKLIHSEINSKKRVWKDKDLDEDVKIWNDKVNNLLDIIKVKRYIGEPEEYFIFCDASTTRYGACIYFFNLQQSFL